MRIECCARRNSAGLGAIKARRIAVNIARLPELLAAKRHASERRGACAGAFGVGYFVCS
jgi:hypothetical protein